MSDILSKPCDTLTSGKGGLFCRKPNLPVRAKSALTDGVKRGEAKGLSLRKGK